MLSLGALAFLQPLFLIGLVALPILWWLLRAVPPAPRRERFPGVRVLLGLEDKERTPQRTPWWLLLLRMIAAALLLFAFAQPLLNPQTRLTGEGPLLLVLDGGWASAGDWAERRGFALDLLAQAEQSDRPTALVNLANPNAGTPDAPARIALLPASQQAEQLAAASPAPWAPDPARWLAPLRSFAASPDVAGLETVWLHDGVEHPETSALAALLAEIPDAAVRLIGPERIAAGLLPPEFRDGALIARAVRAEASGPRALSIRAIGDGAEVENAESGEEASAGTETAAAAFDPLAPPAERRLTQTTLRFADGERVAEAPLDLPLPLLNRLSRLEIAGAPGAGGVTLLDDRFRRKTVAVVSGERVSNAQPLLSSAHYIRNALKPHAVARDATLAGALGLPEPDASGVIAPADVAPGDAWADVIMLADVGSFDQEEEAALLAWVEAGGLLVRFAGPQLAAQTAETELLTTRFGSSAVAEDPLLPVKLRAGGRELGGALSWSTPQPLRAFADDSPFAGLTAPDDVTVERQVLAQPGPQLAERTWASLADGTPLVTARSLGAGRIVLFHVSGRPDWSKLPLSGLFVEMMGRLTATANAAAGDAALSGAEAAGLVWTPTRLLDGYGALVPAPGDLAPIDTETLGRGVAPGVAPGFYEAETETGGAGRALNALDADATLSPRLAAPAGTTVETLGGETETPLKPWLLGAAMLLILIDILAAMALAGRLRVDAAALGAAGRATGRGSAILLAALLLGGVLSGSPAFAQDATPPAASEESPAASDLARIDPAEQRASLETVLAYVVTGDPRVDRVSEAGLEGLRQTLNARTSIEPGAPAGVDLETDEVAVYALIYWPITESQPLLSDAAVRKLNQYMRTGGMLLIDTRDQHRTYGTRRGPNAEALRTLAGRLDMPPLAPAADRHVLTRTFYLLDSFPGRWTGGQIWLEAGSGGEDALRLDGSGSANDGVSPVIIGGHDWAGAWAVDSQGQPLLPIGRGGERQRELALRFGVNVVMYAYTGNYKSDQVHIPSLLERLGN